jgi:hypothetical protein
MLFTVTPVIHQRERVLKTLTRTLFALFLAPVAFASSASANIVGPIDTHQRQVELDNHVIQVVVVRRGGAARRTTVVGPRGGVATRTTVRRGAVVRPGVRPVVRAGGWVRPYRWAPGGAIAAGAAIGFVTAATAVAWAGSPPAPGYCWYYTDPGRTQGFWDACP